MTETIHDTRLVAPLRCAHSRGDSSFAVCGERGRWMRPGIDGIPLGYFCDAHRCAADVPIPAEFLFRRVTIGVDLVFTGAHFLLNTAHQEAFERGVRAVEAVGGLVNLHRIDSRLCRFAATVATEGSRTRAGKGWGR